MDRSAKIYVAGHRGMVGSAIVRALRAAGHADIVTRTSAELDLRDGPSTRAFLAAERPAYVVMAAARVGGIKANATEPYDFLYDNLVMAANVIEGARLAGVRKLLFLGSSCIYPKLAPQPIREDSLLTGPLEVTNEAYAVAKIAGIKLCDHARAQHGCDFISAMPCNLYGTGDNFSLQNSHVLPAMIRKMHEAKLRGDATLRLWGTGTPLREFLHADDLAEACLMLLDRYSQPGHINVGSGEELTIRNWPASSPRPSVSPAASNSIRRCPTVLRANSWTSPASAPSAGSPASPWPTASATPTHGISRTPPKRDGS